ncbi:hypothetical protein ACFLRF_01445 [Candidatus Altiarchaeota archaeon]
MGLLDSFFKKEGARTNEVAFKSLGKWLEARSGEARNKQASSCKPLTESMARDAGKLEAALDKLDSQKEPKDVAERFVKIVRTNKPAYVKGMKRAVNAIRSALDEVSDPVKLNVLLKGEIDTIGKINYGEGRYLVMVYQDIMRKIHTHCKSLLDAQEEVESIITSQDDDDGFGREYERYDEFLKISGSADKIRGLIGENAERARREEDILAGIMKDVGRLRKSSSNANTKKMEEELDDIDSKGKQIEDGIYDSVSRLRRGLRKYSKCCPADEKIVARIVEDPVGTIVSIGSDELSDLLASFDEAARSGAIKLKNKEKTLSRIAKMRKDITDELVGEYLSIRKKQEGLKAGIKEHGIRSAEEKLEKQAKAVRSKISELEKTIAGLKQQNKTSKDHAASLRQDIIRALEKKGVKVLDG